MILIFLCQFQDKEVFKLRQDKKELKLRQDKKELKLRLQKVFNDPNWGQMELHPILVAMINTPEFDRLRNITQMGGTYYVYPACSHNRFEHSIGVAYLAGKLVETLQRNQPELEITYVDALCVKIAGLCHDLGHGPFSHLFDGHFLKKLKKEGLAPHNVTEHEGLSCSLLDKMVRRKEVEDQLSMYGIGKDDIKVIKGLIIGKQDSFYITAAITVIPKAEWKPQDLSNNRQLWYKVKSLKDADSFAIHDLDHKMYLEINAQPTLSPISDDKEPSRLWKIAEGGSLKIDDYCFGHLQERSGSNVISIVNDKDEYLTADSKDKSSHSSTWYFEPRGNDGSCVIYDHERKNALHCNEAGITLLPISSDETPYLWKIDQDSKTIVDANNQKLRYDITNKTVIPSSNAQDNSIVIVANKYNEIDVDKWDYFTRDCHSLGLKHGFDQTRLLNTARVMKRKKADLPWEDDDDHIAYRDAAKQDLIGMFYTRAQLHKRACQHKVSYAVEMMISDALILAEKAGFTYDFWDSENKIIKECKLSESFTNLDAYMALTDNILEKILLWCRKPPENTDKSECTKLLEKITTRKLYKCCYDAPDTSEHRNVVEVCNEKCEEKGMDSAIAVEEIKILRKLKPWNVLIYKKGEKTCTSLARAYKSEADSITSSIHEEKNIRVYCKNEEKAEEISEMFEVQSLVPKRRRLE
ncbi:hypothetical protein EMCRGX_G014979 [Ephydatia muelleri]